MKKTSTPFRFADMPRQYRALCEVFLPRPIHDKIGYENALEVAEAMAGFESSFSRDQSDYFELLTDLISAYEEERERDSPARRLPFQERMRHLLSSAGWTASDLGRFLKLDATMGNKILRGERRLTADHVRILSRHFSLQAEYFL
jgi:antitoxin component HigA of HigAB toxin-antitoxin module